MKKEGRLAGCRSRNGPPRPRNGESGACETPPSKCCLVRDNIDRNRAQSKAEDSVWKLANRVLRDDRDIPSILRTLAQAEAELQHPGLASAISAAEWMWVDLALWQSYEPELARAEVWRNIQIGLAWVGYLRKKAGARP
jgi:hypothetical protein